MVKSVPAMQETQVQSLGQEDSLEEEMATHSSILAWEIPWTDWKSLYCTPVTYDIIHQLYLIKKIVGRDQEECSQLGPPGDRHWITVRSATLGLLGGWRSKVVLGGSGGWATKSFRVSHLKIWPLLWKERGKKAVFNRRSLELKCLSDKNLSKANGTLQSGDCPSDDSYIAQKWPCASASCCVQALLGEAVALDGKLRQILKPLHLQSLKIGNSFLKEDWSSGPAQPPPQWRVQS